MRVGLIGCGNVGVNAHIPAVQANEGITIAAAADPTTRSSISVAPRRSSSCPIG